MLLPQQYNASFVRMAHECKAPMLMCSQLEALPTCVGTRWSALSPTPSCAWSLLPQHHNDPFTRIPQVCAVPVLTSDHEIAGAESATPSVLAWCGGPGAHRCPDRDGADEK